MLHNVGSSIITLKDETTSTAANRFALSADYELAPDQTVLLEYDGTSSRWRIYGQRDETPPASSIPKMFISGLTYANNGSDATNDIDIAAGVASDATGARLITGSAITKQSDVAWAVGTNQGGLDTGAVGNNDYYIWLIERSDTGVVDCLFSLSPTAPTMPANYDYKRLIGWFKRTAGAIVAFTTYELPGGGLEFRWVTPTLDINLSNTLTTSRRTDAVRVPLNFSVEVDITHAVADVAAGQYWIGSPDQADVAVSTSPEVETGSISTGAGSIKSPRLRTSATGTIAARASIATVDTYKVSTLAFHWARRN